MEWVFVVLILGALIYAGMIVIEYTNRAFVVRPRIAKLETETLELLGRQNTAESDLSQGKDRIEVLRLGVSELTSTLADLNREVQAERSRKQRLEIEFYKLQLKGKLRKAAA